MATGGACSKSHPSHLQTSIHVPSIVVDSFVLHFNNYIETQLAICHCPGAAVTIVSDSVVRMIKGYGVRSTQGNEAVNTHTAFRLASVSKIFGAGIAAALINKGKLQWNDRVDQYVPDFLLNPAEQTDQVRINTILAHTTGLPYHSYTNLIEAGYQLNDIVRLFRDIKINNTPGLEYAYQNAAFAMIELVLANVTHTPFPSLLQKELINPLGMQDMTFAYDDLMCSGNVALPHRTDSSGFRYYPLKISNKYYNTICAGGINASISDMSIWLKALMGQYPQVLPRQALDSLFQPMVKTTTDRRYYNYWSGVQDSYYGKGIRILDYGDHYKYYHGGYANEYRAELGIDPRYPIGISALFNSTCPLADVIVPTFFAMYEEWMQGCR